MVWKRPPGFLLDITCAFSSARDLLCGLGVASRFHQQAVHAAKWTTTACQWTPEAASWLSGRDLCHTETLVINKQKSVSEWEHTKQAPIWSVIGRKLRRLTTLRIAHEDWHKQVAVRASTFHKLAQNSPQLLHLELGSRIEVSDESFRAICGLRGLESLSISGESITLLAPLAALAPTLKRLRLDDCGHLEYDDDYLWPLQQLVHLERLYIEYCEPLGQHLDLLRGIVSLRWLSVPGCGPSEASLATLSSLCRLEHLNLWLTNIRSPPIQLPRLVTLRDLCLAGRDLDDASVADLGQTFPLLENLCVFGCPRVTTAPFKSAFPSLRRLWQRHFTPQDELELKRATRFDNGEPHRRWFVSVNNTSIP